MKPGQDTFLIQAPLFMTDRTFFAVSTYPIYTPKRTKFKGYMRENRRSTFNKNR